MKRDDLYQILELVNEMLKSLLELKVRSLYDGLSMSFVKLGMYPSLVKAIIKMPPTEKEFSAAARFLELCACH